MATEFTLFPQLITELRLEVWRLALPVPIRKTLYSYRKECWVPRFLREGDPGFEPIGDNIWLEFDTRYLEPLYVELPLFSVNREARSIAEEFIKNEKLVPREFNARSYDFIRPFNPSTDTVFLSTANAEYFVVGFLDRIHEPDLRDRNISSSNVALPRLAVTPSGLEAFKGDLGLCFRTAGSIGTIYIVDAACDTSLELIQLGDETCAVLIRRSDEQEWEAVGTNEAVIAKLRDLVIGLDEAFSSIPQGYDLRVSFLEVV